MALGFIVFVAVPGPPLPPYSQDFSSADCHYVSFKTMESTPNGLEFNFCVGESVEFRTEYLPNFVSVMVTGWPISMNFTGEHAVKYFRDERNMSFTIRRTFSGPLNFSLNCGSKVLSNFIANVPNAQLKDNDFSYLSEGGVIEKVFLENKQFSIFTPFAVSWSSKEVRDRIGFDIVRSDSQWSYVTDSKRNNSRIDLGYLIPLSDQSPFDLLLCVYPQIAEYIEKNDSEISFIAVDPSYKTTSWIAELLNLKFQITSASTVFNRMIVPEIKFITPNTSIASLLERNLSALRKYVKQKVGKQSDLILIEWELDRFLNGRIREICRKCVVRKLGDDIEEWSEVRSAKVVVASGVNSLAALILMQTGTTFIDVSSDEFQCEWTEKFASSNGINYRAINNGTCLCNEFWCYARNGVERDLSVFEIESFAKILEELVTKENL
jgi:hypothetical protein